MTSTYQVTIETKKAMRVFQRIIGLLARHRLTLIKMQMTTLDQEIYNYHLLLSGSSKSMNLFIQQGSQIIELMKLRIEDVNK